MEKNIKITALKKVIAKIKGELQSSFFNNVPTPQIVYKQAILAYYEGYLRGLTEGSNTLTDFECKEQEVDIDFQINT